MKQHDGRTVQFLRMLHTLVSAVVGNQQAKLLQVFTATLKNLNIIPPTKMNQTNVKNDSQALFEATEKKWQQPN